VKRVRGRRNRMLIYGYGLMAITGSDNIEAHSGRVVTLSISRRRLAFEIRVVPTRGARDLQERRFRPRNLDSDR